MDSSMMKFLEEDEGLNLRHSPPPSRTDSGVGLSQGINHTPGQLFQQCQSSKREEDVKAQIQDPRSSAMEVNRHGSSFESQHPPNHTSGDINHDPSEPNRPQDDQHNVHMSQAMNMQNSDKNPAQNITQNLDNECQLQRMQRMSNQQDKTTGQAANAMNRTADKLVPIGLLLPAIQRQVDKDRAMQLQVLYKRLKSKNIKKNDFHRQMRTLVGDHIIKIAVYKLQHGQLCAKQNTQKLSPFVAASSIHQSLAQSNLPMEKKPQDSLGSGVPGSSKDNTFEMLSSRPGFLTPMNKIMPKSITAQLERESVSGGSLSSAAGSNAMTPPKKPTGSKKKPLEVPSVSALSKKQKVSGAFLDQSIEQLNDVTAVSGLNLREEEEQLFRGSKKDTRVSEASRKVVQEEEGRLFLRKISLQKKVAEIMAKCGVKNKSNDVDRCLSLCVEERMHGLITNLIRLSKQRVNIEKPRQRTVITSDVWQQIMTLNRKAQEEQREKQADADKFKRADEVNNEEDNKKRTTTANVAARAAVGVDDMMSKWKLTAEQVRQKPEGGPDALPASQPSADAGLGPKPVSTSERNSPKDNPDTETTSGPVIVTCGLCPSGDSMPFLHTVSVKDVISVLEREIQMSRSTLIYHLYEQVHSDSVSE